MLEFRMPFLGFIFRRFRLARLKPSFFEPAASPRWLAAVDPEIAYPQESARLWMRFGHSGATPSNTRNIFTLGYSEDMIALLASMSLKSSDPSAASWSPDHPLDLLLDLPAWDISADESLTAEHPMLARAFLSRCEMASRHQRHHPDLFERAARSLALSSLGLAGADALPLPLACSFERSLWSHRHPDLRDRALRLRERFLLELSGRSQGLPSRAPSRL